MRIFSILTTLTLAGCSSLVMAQDNPGISFGIQGGTTGIGAQLAAPLSEVITVRGSYNIFSYDTELNSDNVEYDAELDKDSLGILLDWHILGSGFRLTGGAFIHNDNSMSVLATPSSGTYDFNGTTYDASQAGSILGDVSFNKTTPYFGIGWGNASHGEGLSFMLDAGVQMQDSPSASLTAVNCQLGVTLCAQLDSDLQAEIAQVESDGEDFELWPVINLGVVWHF